MTMEAFLILAALAFTAWVVIDYQRNRLSRCPRCKGSGQLSARFWPNRYRACPRCNRRGEIGRR
ncbi:hypothetical protein FXF51_06285 [Nonomuraea sp. PA05]|uniref:hypothetical protein n=1 Tax=Nonomuraea sp. PA05 TaxID=2604466 RepID=UPI0011DAD62B|nr:hypothetical protein [Nonomuraea sp. PA05]TYB69769.1 hypothetical protein FXF51_06285 [Nonomuraea sp. PA05]